MNLKKAIDKLKFDVRMVNLNVQNGSLKKDDFEKFRDQLSDLSSKTQEVDIDLNEKSSYDEQ